METCSSSSEDIEKWKRNLKAAFSSKNHDVLSTLLHNRSREEGSEFEKVIKEETWIFTSLCDLGACKIIEWLLRIFQLDVNMTQDGMTGIQLASQAGHADVVELLLSNGAILKQEVWDEYSEFYLATIGGHNDVICVLMASKPDLICDVEVGYCLFHAACKGGSLNLAYRWLTPDVDVNKKVSHLKSLEECEYQYPLFAACEGAHYNIAEFLICDLNAQITKDICCKFPEFTCRLVRHLFRISSHSGEQKFSMRNLELDHVTATWFENPCTLPSNDENARPDSYSDNFETEIDLSKNKLSFLPSEIIWQLPSLIYLNISENPLKSLPCRKDGVALHTNCLTSLFVMHCQLTELNAHIFQLPNLEELDASYNHIESLEEDMESTKSWKCHQLKKLNLSHNHLSHLPSSLKECIGMEILNVSYNALTCLCSPWQCPLKYLDISHNEICAFPPSCDQFWADSLHTLKASHNKLDQLHESMVKMNVLKSLDVSYNLIYATPKGNIWSCPLIDLNLSYNKLGIKHTKRHDWNRVASIEKSYTPAIELPPSCLSDTLNELYLNHNDLKSIPNGLCHLQTLTVLDISGNCNLTSLPLEMGMLWNLLILKVKGIKVEDKDIRAKINDLNDENNKSFQTYDFVLYMEQRRRHCIPQDLIKMMVFGCKNSGGQCIVQKIIQCSKQGVRKQEYKHEHKTLRVSNWKLSYSKRLQTNCKRDLTFQAWEFPVNKFMNVTHPCFLTENSLYLIVHDAFYENDHLDTVSQQIAAIRASVSQPCIIVACLFSSLKDEKFNDLSQILKHKIGSLLKCLYVPVIFNDKTSFELLLATIYSKASQMPNVFQGKQLLLDRLVPKSFIEIGNKIKNIDKQFCSRDELLSVLKLVPKDLQDTVDRRLRLQEYLLQIGAMLHYSVQMGDLWNLVILDPVWLYDLLSSFMEFLHYRRAKIGMTLVKQFSKTEIGLDLFPAFLSLLEFFNIGMRLEESNHIESLLIPSLLPEQPLEFLSNDITYTQATFRLYCLPTIPKALWSQVICQLIPAFNRFTNPDLTLPDFVTYEAASDDLKKSFRRGKRKSYLSKGLNVKNKGIQFWATGIMVWHDQGLIVVEEVKYNPHSSRGDPIKGILVTVKTRGDVTQSNSISPSFKDLSAIGVVTDEMEEILELFDPKLMEYMVDYQPIALCPHCYHDIKPGQGIITQEIDHFQIATCAEMILWEDIVFCGKKAVCLHQLIPEFVFLELPEKFHIQHKDLELMEEKLGQGMVGSVIKGRYQNVDVAIKSFYTPPSDIPLFERNEDPLYPNDGCNKFLHQSMTQWDHNDTERKKILNAFLDLRREVSILSKLKHRCIIDFLGVCFKRELLMVLELAPLGSFRSCLKNIKEKNEIPMYKPTATDPKVITKSVFGKDLTYKILLQISSGLLYLHSQNIIFRDLKPDNILVLSLDLDADINVKVSDYGISRFTTNRGVSGLVGTLCYMAPEVLAKQTYTNKVDVYSLGIVIFETVTGVAPAELLGTNQHPMVSEIAKTSNAPMHVKFYKVSCNFPFLESLMEECWAYKMDERPSIKEVIRRMSLDQFLLLHKVLWSDPFSQPLQVTCIYSCQSGGRLNLWISESTQDGSLRLLSVYDITSSMYTVRRTPVTGNKIIAMAKVRDKIWLISEGCKDTEVIVRCTQNKFEVKPGTYLEEEPSSLVCHNWRPSKDVEDHAFVLIGHTNGTITTYHMHTEQHRTVTTMTKLVLSTDYPISNIITTGNNVLIAAAEQTVFLLTIQEQISGDGLLHPSISVNWSYSFFTSLGIIEHLNILVADKEDCMWCSFAGKNRILKFDWREKTVKENLTFSYDSIRDLANVVYEDPLNNSISQQGNMRADVNPPPRPLKKSTLSAGTGISSSDNGPPPIPLRKSQLLVPIGISSLCLSSNLLAVGTDQGSLFLVPLCNNLKDVCPFQLPLLHHLQGKDETESNMKMHLDSVTPIKYKAENTKDDTYYLSVSKIIHAGNSKLVSLLKFNPDECIMRKNLTLKKTQRQHNRLGGVFQVDNIDALSYDDDDDDDNHGGETSNTFQTRTINNKRKSYPMTNYAEIAIWDDVSDARLNVIKGYKKGFC